jgi:FkbM family methyltransferase
LRLRPDKGDLFVFYEVLAFDAYALPDDFLAPDEVRTIVDCGANVGMTSLFLAQRYPAARIFAIEAEPENFAILKHNTAAVDRIIPIHAAVTGSPKELVRFSTGALAWGNKILDGAANSEYVDVPAITMEALIHTHGLGRIDLLKVDIEGGEEDLFKHPGFLAKVGTIMIELHGDYTLDIFRAAIAPLGFRADPPDAYPGVSIATARRVE